ncbi:MAG: hypothetical protein AAGA48_21535 [Myxococcota bacterium]
MSERSSFSGISATEQALRLAAEQDPTSRAMVVLLDYWAEHGRPEWSSAARVFLFERPKATRLLFARMPGSPPDPHAETALRIRLDASEALFFGQPVEAVTARFEVSWNTGQCRFDQDMRLRLHGSYGIDWLQPSRFVEWLGCGYGVPLTLPPDRNFLNELSTATTRWVSSGCPGHGDVRESWFEDWGDAGWMHTS